MAPKTRAPKAIRRAVANGAAARPNINLSVDTIQLAHEALVQMRASNSQITLAKAKAMNELEGLLQVFGAQQAAQQGASEDAEPAPAADTPAPAAPAPKAAPARAKRRSR